MNRHLAILLLILSALGVVAVISVTFRMKDYRDEIRQSNRRIDSLNSVVKQGYQVIHALTDSIQVKDRRIAEIDRKDSVLIVKQKQKDRYYEDLIRRYRNAPISRLDSFIWTRYPDSTTVAARSHRP